MRSFACALFGAMIEQLLRQIAHPRPRRNRTLARAVAFAPETKAYIPAHPVECASVEEGIISALNDCLHEQWRTLESALHIAEGLTRDEAIELLKHLDELGYSIGTLQLHENLRADIEYIVYLRRAKRHITSAWKNS